MTDKNKLPLTSTDVTSEVLAQLREIAPQVFTEGGVDFDKLKATLGESIVPKEERYGLNWAGKSEAFRNVQIPSVGTLLPQPEESVNFDTSENLIIEGDNLEVLKLLQKSYHSKVKMIYIDPPYNTGNEFIYPDNYREGLDDYLKYSGQVSEEGVKQSTNTETSGRFHSKWLNMMYPRLFLARNLLREDGVIFVSIDDNEVHNLRMLMNEVFGEENFLGSFLWKKKGTTTNVEGAKVSSLTEYVLCYGRNGSEGLNYRIVKKETRSYPFQDSEGQYRKTVIEKKNAGDYERKTMQFDIIGHKPREGKRWQIGEESARALESLNRFVFENGIVKLKIYDFEDKDTTSANPNILFEHGSTDSAGQDLADLLSEPELFSNPKPTELIQHLLKLSTQSRTEAVVLDFFAGSGTTASAVLGLNRDDGGNRKFILVQLPEKTEHSQYPTIAHITRERVRQVVRKLNTESPSNEQDRGFKAFKLTSSNFKIWNADTTSTEPEAIAEQLRLYADNVEQEHTQQDILYELVLKSGLLLSAKVEQIEVDGKPVYSIAQGQLLICLEDEITQAVLRGMIALNPIQMVCLDRAFCGNDQNKTNTVLEAKSQGVTFKTV